MTAAAFFYRGNVIMALPFRTPEELADATGDYDGAGLPGPAHGRARHLNADRFPPTHMYEPDRPCGLQTAARFALGAVGLGLVVLAMAVLF